MNEINNILIVSSDNIPHVGGKSTHVMDLKDGLTELKVSVGIVSLNSVNKKINRAIQFICLPIYLIGKKTYLKVYKKVYMSALSFKISKEVKVRSVDIISAQDAIAAILAKKASRKYKIPIVLTMHTYFGIEPLLDKKSASVSASKILQKELKSLDYVSSIICVDNRIAQHVTDTIKKTGHSIPVNTILNFTNTEKFKPYKQEDKNRLRQDMGIEKSAIIISCFRRLVEKNGVIYLIKSMKNIIEKYKDISFYLFGDGPQKEVILQYVLENSLEKNVVLFGDIDNNDILKYYGISDITVVPSITVMGLQEATSIAAIESMSMGLPVVASNIGGLKELIIDQETGLLVEERNIEQLSKSLITLIESPEMRLLVGKKSREYVIANNSHTIAAKKYLGIYNNVN